MFLPLSGLAADDVGSLQVFLRNHHSTAHEFMGFEGTTLLHHAAQQGSYRIVHWLTHDQGLDVNARNVRGRTPLFVAASTARMESTKIVKTLLQGGADPTIPSNSQTTCLMVAQTADVLRELLDDGRIDLQAQDFDGHTALHFALFARRKAEWAIPMLLEAGASPWLEDSRGKLPLYYLGHWRPLRAETLLREAMRARVLCKARAAMDVHHLLAATGKASPCVAGRLARGEALPMLALEEGGLVDEEDSEALFAAVARVVTGLGGQEEALLKDLFVELVGFIDVGRSG